MIQLPASLQAWGTPQFRDTLKAELARLGAGALPLQQGLSSSSVALDERPEVLVMSAVELTDRIRVKLGVFYAGVIAGCSCADDPTPVSEQTEYCQLQLDIDKGTATATVTLLDSPAGD